MTARLTSRSTRADGAVMAGLGGDGAGQTAAHRRGHDAPQRPSWATEVSSHHEFTAVGVGSDVPEGYPNHASAG